MWQRTPEELRQALSAPFTNGDIEWRVSATNRDKTKGLAVPYVTNRAIQNRLDDTVGIDGWHNEFMPWKDGKAQLCGISIFFPQQKQWLTKWDGADDSDIESVKGGLSDSMKRAAVEWGIGRYLYGMTQVWVKIEQRGKGYGILDDEWPRLNQAHENWVAKLRSKNQAQSQGNSQPQGGSPSQGQRREPPAQGRQPQPANQQRPPQNGQPAHQRSNPPQGAQQPGPQPRSGPSAGNAGLKEGFYLVLGAVLKPTVSGGTRTSVQLQNCAGQCVQAYTKQADSRLAPGVTLCNVKMNTRSKDGVTFYTLDAYDIVTYTAQDAA